MAYWLFVHSTSNRSSTLYDVASKTRANTGRGATPTADTVRQMVVEKATERFKEEITKQATKAANKAVAKATRHIETLASHPDAVDVWTRCAPPSRRPRVSRDDIAAAAIHIADTEGLDALSMRRLAIELEIGTMSLYHYVRTKDELLTLVLDEIISEVLIPETTPMPRQWRAAVTLIARRSRDSLLRHPWVLDINDDPPIGPNAMRHFDQTLQAVSPLEAALADKLDLMAAVDNYVFGYCLGARNNLHHDEANSKEMLRYVEDLFATGHYPALAKLVNEQGLESLWNQIQDTWTEPEQFDRNLSRILDGFEADLARRHRRRGR